jgi:molecular chaperone GrpE
MDESTRSAGVPPAGDDGGRRPRALDDDIEEPPAAGATDDPSAAAEEPPAGAAAPAGAPEATDYKDRWLRAEAELQNFRRRASREWEEGRRAAEESVLLEMVAVLDDLERALATGDPGSAPDSGPGSGAAGAWTQGVALVAQRIRDFLARQGVAVEDPLGRAFDPVFHEALLELDAPEGTAPGTVIQVIHKGYRRGARALRTARVVVARAPAGSRS